MGLRQGFLTDSLQKKNPFFIDFCWDPFRDFICIFPWITSVISPGIPFRILSANTALILTAFPLGVSQGYSIFTGFCKLFQPDSVGNSFRNSFIDSSRHSVRGIAWYAIRDFSRDSLIDFFLDSCRDLSRDSVWDLSRILRGFSPGVPGIL